MQGTLLFSALLLLLWVPLLAFSSGNPTYQVPNVVSFSANATLGVVHGNASDHLDTLSFPLFDAGASRSRQNWVADSADLPLEVRDTYNAGQTKLLCLAEVSFPALISACVFGAILREQLKAAFSHSSHIQKAWFALQDSDSLWLASPPQRAAMRHGLKAHNATFSLGWHIQRDAPLAGAHGGPECAGVQVVPLSPDSRSQVVAVLQVCSQTYMPQSGIDYNSNFEFQMQRCSSCNQQGRCMTLSSFSSMEDYYTLLISVPFAGICMLCHPSDLIKSSHIRRDHI